MTYISDYIVLLVPVRVSHKFSRKAPRVVSPLKTHGGKRSLCSEYLPCSRTHGLQEQEAVFPPCTSAGIWELLPLIGLLLQAGETGDVIPVRTPYMTSSSVHAVVFSHNRCCGTKTEYCEKLSNSSGCSREIPDARVNGPLARKSTSRRSFVNHYAQDLYRGLFRVKRLIPL